MGERLEATKFIKYLPENEIAFGAAILSHMIH